MSTRRPAQRLHGPRGIKYIVAVASGGRVGSRPRQTNLALAWRSGANGSRDADIWRDCSSPVDGITGQSDQHRRGKTLQTRGMGQASCRWICSGDTPMIWRGPMVQSALQQMLRDVVWERWIFLIVDMPPGTGVTSAVDHGANRCPLGPVQSSSPRRRISR